MSNVKANTKKPKRDKYTWLIKMLYDSLIYFFSSMKGLYVHGLFFYFWYSLNEPNRS